ncbi:MAG: DNA repair ATPase [Saprospiraceae bacterium]|nr:DNA repair ATPase [Saprospiraceae bacterium]
MADDNTTQNPEENASNEIKLEGGTYEIIKGRLKKQGDDLRGRLSQLNEERKKVFGSIEMRLTGNSRINTSNNCIARDIFSVGNLCLFGYNVKVRLRPQVELQDVFSIYQFRKDHFEEATLDILAKENPQFETDFKNLYRYYRDAVFAKFAIDQTAPYFYMIFQLSQDVNDTKTFKWHIMENGSIQYDTTPGEQKYSIPKQHDFTWKRATRDMQRMGNHPHVSILDRVFVETVGGDLTIKVEDNTEDGKGIYSEEVTYADQKLDDAEISFADLDNLIALKIRPYQEEPRYFIFNEKLQTVQRIDALAYSGNLLPGGQGLIFSNGFYLQTGDYKIFDKTTDRYIFERQVSSPNGEDFLFIFFNQEKGAYLLLSYNIIEQNVNTPIYCNGYTLFGDGELCYFRSEDNATKHHVIQIWQTPYLEGSFIPSKHTDNYLYKVGNRDIVRAMAECQELLSMMDKDETYSDLYYDLTKKASDILDSYFFLRKEGAFNLDEPLIEIQASSNSAIDEFEKVQNIRKNTKATIKATQQKAEQLFRDIGGTSFNRVDSYVQALADLRTIRGEIISLRDLRYADIPLIESLEEKAATQADELSQECVEFLLKENALQPYIDRVNERRQDIDGIETAKQGKRLEEKIDAIGKELELLIEIVSNLKIDDPTQTTRIIDSITSIFSILNQVKAAIKRKLRDLMGAEAVAEFAAQMKLLDQGVINYLDISDTPAKCDEYLTKLMIQLEELESKFAEFDEYLLKITEKREEVYNAFDTRKLALVEAINKRTASLEAAAKRILNGIRNRANGLKEVTQINGFFASDLMIDKVRDIIKQLQNLDDANKASDIQTQLKTIKEEAIRQLRDKQDLFTGGGDAIRFGRHSFAVNKQQLDLTLIPRSNSMYYHLTGTGFFEEVDDEEFLSTKSVWNQSLVSENPEVYRSEYLAYICLAEIRKQNLDIRSDEILEFIQKFSANRYHEGYSKGIHDEDAAKLLDALVYLSKHIDLLYFASDVRACAAIFWQKFLAEEEKIIFHKQLKSAGVILRVFPNTHEFDYLLENLTIAIREFCQKTELFDEYLATRAAQYLFQEISRHDYFIISGEAHNLKHSFKDFLDTNAALRQFKQSLDSLEENAVDQFQLARKWLNAYVEQQENKDSLRDYIDEVATLLILGSYQESYVVDVKMQKELTEMRGTHNAIGEGGVYHLDFNKFMRKMEHYEGITVPSYERFTQMKRDLVDKFRVKLRLEEFRPRVLSSFVRNKLIDSLYLPIFGDNLAKQIGTVGDNTRTDRMGMLLLISPPGYGKTTLMEYVANRLGLIFMKINGPAIGHRVISLDPSEANTAAAGKELEKLNLSLEMGDNVMIYLDDIQHCNPEFLQKFISLTDAQRKIEGVYKGVTKTYDLRGKRVCVVMAGNPYTESGDKFQIPDMLANRSDIYNLGDIIGDTKDVFEMSYIENSMTSNAILQKLAAKSTKDIYAIIRYSSTGSKEGLDFEANHTPQELEEYANIIKKMLTVRDAILKVNLEYIRSAAMSDEYRTEPAFKLQGSYRNMNKLAEKIVPIMNEKELQTLLVAHYEGESQTLTSDAESNMLKFKEMIGAMTDEEQQRWKEMKAAFNKNKLLKGSESDPMTQMVVQLSNFSDGLKSLQETIELGLEKGLSQENTGRRSNRRNSGTVRF